MKKNMSLKFYCTLALILIHASNQNFLQFDTKTKCPKTPLTSLGILISLADDDDDKLFSSVLTQKERENYEDIVVLKRSFSSTMSYIPQSFSPEDDDYWSGLNYLLIVFIIIAIFPIIFILFYIFMRFILKKCTGPKKITEVNKTYRNTTWLIMIISSFITAILFAVVLSKSVAVGNNIEKTFNYAVSSISESDKVYPEINEVVKLYREKSDTIPDDTYMKNFEDKIGLYISNTKKRTQQILDDDSKRTKITAFVFAGYYILVLLAYLFFFFKNRNNGMYCINYIIFCNSWYNYFRRI